MELRNRRDSTSLSSFVFDLSASISTGAAMASNRSYATSDKPSTVHTPSLELDNLARDREAFNPLGSNPVDPSVHFPISRQHAHREPAKFLFPSGIAYLDSRLLPTRRTAFLRRQQAQRRRPIYSTGPRSSSCQVGWRAIWKSVRNTTKSQGDAGQTSCAVSSLQCTQSRSYVCINVLSEI